MRYVKQLYILSFILVFIVVRLSFFVAKSLFSLKKFWIFNIFFFSLCIVSLKCTQRNTEGEQRQSPNLLTNFNSLWLFCRDAASESTVTYPCITHSYGKIQICFTSQMLFFCLMHPQFIEGTSKERFGPNSYLSLEFKRSNHFNICKTA